MRKLKLKSSKYNLIVHSDSKMLIFNSISGSIVVFSDEKEIRLVKEILHKPNVFESELKNQLVDLTFLVPEAKDESGYLISNFIKNSSERKLHITIIPTLKCNFECHYCFIRPDSIMDMSVSTYVSIIEFISSKVINEKYNLVEITWFGGEPSLKMNDIVSFMEQLKNVVQNINIKSVMITNGYLLNYDSFLKLYDCGIKHFQITFDGDRKSHDDIRYIRNGSGTFDSIWGNLLDIRDNAFEFDYEINIRTSFMKDNIKNQYNLIDDYFQFFYEDHHFSIGFKPILDIFNENINVCNKTEVKQTISLLNMHLNKKCGDELISDISLYTPIKKWCNATFFDTYIIKPNGLVFNCDSIMHDSEKAIGKIDKLGMSFNENHMKWHKYIVDYICNGKCVNCIALPLCYGGCVKKKLIECDFGCSIDLEYVRSSLKKLFL